MYFKINRIKKLLLILLCLPMIGLSQVNSNESFTFDLIKNCPFTFFDIEEGKLKMLSYSEKKNRGYLIVEKELRGYFNIDTDIKLFFNDNLIGDLNGDRINDFIILTEEGIFLFKISNGQYFAIPIEQPRPPDYNKYKYEGINSLFFTNINNGKLEGVVEDVYYRSSDDEWYYPISAKDFTLQELYQLRKFSEE